MQRMGKANMFLCVWLGNFHNRALSQRNISYIPNYLIIIADERKCQWHYGQWKLNEEQLGYRSKILKKYVAAKLEREVHFLYGLQHLMHEMQHPNSKL